MLKFCPDDIVKRLDEVSWLLHRYRFALVDERDKLVSRAHDIVSTLSLDISIDNACKEFDDEN